MKKQPFDILQLKATIGKGNLKIAIQTMIDVVNHNAFSWSKEIYLIASQFQSLEKDKMRRIISREDYSIELNIITNNILELLDLINDEKANSNPTEILQRLNEEFENIGENIKSRTVKLRTKNDLMRKMGDVLVQFPLLVSENLTKSSEGIMNGICRKIILVPSFEDVNILLQFVDETNSSFTKGNIVNAFAELIYNGKLSIGDEAHIRTALAQLAETEDLPLQKNIERVEAALDYLINGNTFLNKTKQDKSSTLLDDKNYVIDKRIKGIIQTINEVHQQSPTKLDTSFFLTQINKLFNRMTFRGEPQIELCRSGRWSKRVHSALMTHDFLLQLEPIFIKKASKNQIALYQQILLNISQYIDSMIAYLFKEKNVSEDEIRPLLGKPEFVTRFKENEEIVFEEHATEEGIIMDEKIKTTINKYLGQSIELVDVLI